MQMASSPPLRILSLEVKLTERKLCCQVQASAGGDATYAWYVYRNDERIHVEWYSAKPAWQYVLSKPGRYKVAAFVRDAQGRQASKMGEVCEFLGSRSLQRWNSPVFHFEDKAAFLKLQSMDDGIYSVKYPDTYVDMLFRNDEKCPETLLISFHGAMVDRKEKSSPWFVGVKVTNGKGNCLFLSDPCMNFNEDLSLAWYAGFKGFAAQQELLDIIRHVVKVTGAQKIVFIGGSGGGFAALYYGSFFEEALVVSYNPQTEIEKYFYLPQYLRLCFDAGEEQARQILEENIQGDLRNCYVPKLKNYILYLQNSTDMRHVRDQMLPFLQHLQAECDWNSEKGPPKGWSLCQEHPGLIRGCWGDGHVAPPADALAELFEKIACWERADFAGFLSPENMRNLAEICTKIKDVQIKLQENRLCCRTLAKGDAPLLYAWYVYRDGERIHVEWYSAKPAWQYVLSKPGRYKVTAFVRDAQGRQASSTSGVCEFLGSRSLTQWNAPVFHFKDKAAFLKMQSMDNGIYSVKYPDTYVDMLFRKDEKRTDTLFICFHAAITTRKETVPPFFKGMKITRGQGNCLFLSDPCMNFSEDVSLAWYAGFKGFAAQQELLDIIRHVVKVTGAQKVVFTGGSGGGFAALYYGSFFEGALVVPYNPQTEIAEYPYFSQYLHLCFDAGEEPARQILEENIQGDLRNCYTPKLSNYILYLQNETDTEPYHNHINKQMLPFLEHLQAECDWNSEEGTPMGWSLCQENLGLIRGCWGEGHVAPPAKALAVLFEKIGSWERADFAGFLSPENMRNLAEICAGNVKIKEVQIKLQENRLCFRTLAEGDAPLLYAWYVYRDGERIHVEWYTAANEFFFSPEKPGSYQVKAFVKNKYNRIASKETASVLLVNSEQVQGRHEPKEGAAWLN